ncbi:hypothetical protein [Actinophytocola sp.]|uniref:hypothetical protein n=1 Tax=Actinophytocola sp. TaxID=1872138 RepID=UPI002D66CA53|nr:hypothetical protein [Actinophytocola sp.]HYQ66719.1 hypothetical protein [Actinophytocola sp.]
MATTTTMIRLLHSIRGHLTTHRLPAEIASIKVDTDMINGDHVVVHLWAVQLPALAAALLDWADTLTAISATAWRPPGGHSVHLSITGRLADETAVEVYGGVDYTDELFGDLQPGGRQSVALPILRSWAANGSAVAA